MVEQHVQRTVGTGVMLLLAATVAFLFIREGRSLGPGLTVWVEMEHAGPLVTGSQVRVGGRTIGSVQDIGMRREHEGGGRVVLKLWIARRHAWLVREHSEFFVNQPSLLSEPYLEIGLPHDGEPGEAIADGSTVHGVDPPSIDRLLGRSFQTLRELADLVDRELPEIDLLVDESRALGDDLDVVKGEWKMDGVVRAKGEVLTSIAWLAGSGVSPADLSGVKARGEALVARTRAAAAVLRQHGELLVARADELRDRLAPGMDAKVAALRERLDAAAAALERVTAAGEALLAIIDKGEGSLAAFAADGEIVDEVKDLTKLLKAQPWHVFARPQTRRITP